MNSSQFTMRLNQLSEDMEKIKERISAIQIYSHSCGGTGSYQLVENDLVVRESIFVQGEEDVTTIESEKIDIERIVASDGYIADLFVNTLSIGGLTSYHLFTGPTGVTGNR